MDSLWASVSPSASCEACFPPCSWNRKEQSWLGNSRVPPAQRPGFIRKQGVSGWGSASSKLERLGVSWEQLAPACVPLRSTELRLLRCELVTCSSGPSLCPHVLEKRQLQAALMRPNCTPCLPSTPPLLLPYITVSGPLLLPLLALPGKGSLDPLFASRRRLALFNDKSVNVSAACS